MNRKLALAVVLSIACPALAVSAQQAPVLPDTVAQRDSITQLVQQAALAVTHVGKGGILDTTQTPTLARHVEFARLIAERLGAGIIPPGLHRPCEGCRMPGGGKYTTVSEPVPDSTGGYRVRIQLDAESPNVRPGHEGEMRQWAMYEIIRVRKIDGVWVGHGEIIGNID